MKNRKTKAFSLLLTALLLAALLPTMCVPAFAGHTSTGTISAGSIGTTMKNGYIYKVNSTMTVTDLKVDASATVILYIPSGVTLTANGSTPSAAGEGGNPGIELKSGSTLIVVGGGTLKATGGKGANAANGANGGGAYYKDNDNSLRIFYSGAGGAGGTGAGGGGAGIGTKGGSGGAGGAGGGSAHARFVINQGGAGDAGKAGGSSASAGNLYRYGVTVTAKHGYGGSAGGTGGRGTNEDYLIYAAAMSQTYYQFYGGVGGNGGCAGGNGNDIGSGGCGGGGGAGGRAGGLTKKTQVEEKGELNINTTVVGNGGNGAKGGNGTDFGAASSKPSAMTYSATLNGNGGSGGSAGMTGYYGLSCSVTVPSKTGYSFAGYYYGGTAQKDALGTVTGYSGGTRIVDGSGNGVWTLATNNATLNGIWSGKSYTVTLNKDSGTGGSDSVSAKYGAAMPGVTSPTRTGYTFGGYYSGSDGTGTKYYNDDGTGAAEWNVDSAQSLYAKWTLNTYNITYMDGSTTITDSTAAKIFDRTATYDYESSVTLPTAVAKDNRAFEGWYWDSACSDGQEVSGWTAGDYSGDKTVYAKWAEFSGTRADSEELTVPADSFASPATYQTARVTVRLDGTGTNVNLVELRQGEKTYTMAGSDGSYSYTTDETVSGSWDVWVNGRQSPVTAMFAEEAPTAAEVDLVNATVTVRKDDTPAAGYDIILKSDSESLPVAETDTVGTYTVQTFAKQESCQIFIDGADTGIALSLADKNSCRKTVDYRTVAITTKTDGESSSVNSVELRSGTDKLSVTGSAGIYTLTGLEDAVTSYDVYIDSQDTELDVKFTAADGSRTVNYHTVTVTTNKNGTPSDIDDVTLRDANGAVVFPLNRASAGCYTIVKHESAVSYRVYVGSKDTGKTASFTDSGKTPDAVAYYTVEVTTGRDGAAANMGTVELKPESGSKTVLPAVGTGIYELTQPDHDTVYEVVVGGEATGQTVKFTADERLCTVAYTTVNVTAKLDDTAANIGTLVLRQTDCPDIALSYVTNAYQGQTCRIGTYDIYLNGADTGVNYSVGTPCTLNYYTLSYGLNGGSGVFPAAKSYLEGTQIIVPTDNPTKADSQFVGWQDTASPTPHIFKPKADGSYDQLTISSDCHSLTALWSGLSDFDVKYSSDYGENWSYASAEDAAAYAAEHSNQNVQIVMQRSFTMTAAAIPENAALTVPADCTLSGSFTNNGSIECLGTISGTVTNAGTIDGGGTMDENDALKDAGTVAALVNQSGGTARLCNVESLVSNAGTLTDCRIAAGTNLSGTVTGTIYAESGVTFASTLRPYNSNGTKTVISLVGGGTITANTSGQINAATAFAGLMLPSETHFVSAAEIHLRNKLAVSDNRMYADFFDFTAPSSIVDGSAHPAVFSGGRTAGIGEITEVYYRQKTGTSTWSEWSETPPTGVGIYQVKINVANGEYYYGKNGVYDEAVWTFDMKMPIVIRWENTTQEYTGEALSPTATLVGLEEGHTEVSYQLNNESRVNAGTYRVSATLTGTDSEYYKITNPQTSFNIQKAPVTFSVSNTIQKYDGSEKEATVTASPNVEFTVSYRAGNGSIGAKAMSEGDYDVCVLLSDTANQNYRIAGSADGKLQKIGSLTVYSEAAPVTYTVSFNCDGAIGSIADLDAVQAGVERTLPDSSGISKEGYFFTGWEIDGKTFKAGEIFTQPEANVTLKAKWTQSVYTIDGTVTKGGNSAQGDVVMTLMSGSREIAKEVTQSEGKYCFSDLLPGIYNLVISYNGAVVTKGVEIKSESVYDVNIQLPVGKTNSVVEVEAGSPEVIVFNLEKSFEDDCASYTAEDKTIVNGGGSVEFKLEVAQNSAPEIKTEDLETIKKKSSNIEMYLDINLTKTVQTEGKIISNSRSEKIHTFDQLLEVHIPIPTERRGKSKYNVFRLHSPDGTKENEALEQMEEITETDYPTEEGYCISAEKDAIIIYTRNFSLYTITEEVGDASFAASLTLEDSIDINFYVKLPTAAASANIGNYTVVSTFDGKEYANQNMNGAPYIEKDGITSYRVVVASAYSYEMTKPVTVDVYYGAGDDRILLRTITYSVQQYCESIIADAENDYSENLKELCRCTLDYGAAAQQYFNGKTYWKGNNEYTYDVNLGNLANRTYHSNAAAVRPSNTANITGSINGFDSFSRSLVLGTKTAIKVYFKSTNNVSEYTFTCEQGNHVTAPVLGGDGRYYVLIEGISAPKLKTDYTLKITETANESNTMSVIYSPFAFANSKWDSTTIGNLVKPLVKYGNSASTYFDE